LPAFFAQQGETRLKPASAAATSTAAVGHPQRPRVGGIESTEVSKREAARPRGTNLRREADMPALEQKQIDQLTAMMDERWAREFREIRSLFSAMDDERQRVTLGESVDEATDDALLVKLSAVDDPVIRQNLQDVRDILGARQRIAAGKYGECTDCGADIAYERLLAYPTAKRCIGCQREHEKRKVGR
jgi:RNA polymerase-binding transcription factor DksA